MPQTKTPAQTYSAKGLAVLVSKTIGRTVSPKQIRGRVRGDAGEPLLDRFGPDSKADYASHVYSADEADLIGEAFVAAHNKRSGGHTVWRSVGPKAQRKVAPRKPRNKTVAAPSIETVAADESPAE